ncbi:hypothetical protein MTR67_024238 [Solanum verrucosum]|uniref:Transmembrane protein n=1 Tax=Solanum verrucosum TaxID=315347 RepID=A0AAF0QX35_SOLVR|nr:hypothetical protein MTR67_024238 [Solanum verrucosum]
MLVGGDLGFLSSLVVAAFMAVFGSVSSFMVRWKWRRSVARRDEIKRCESLKEEDEVFVETPASSATISTSYSGSFN